MLQFSQQDESLFKLGMRMFDLKCLVIIWKLGLGFWTSTTNYFSNIGIWFYSRASICLLFLFKLNYWILFKARWCQTIHSFVLFDFNIFSNSKCTKDFILHPKSLILMTKFHELLLATPIRSQILSWKVEMRAENMRKFV